MTDKNRGAEKSQVDKFREAARQLETDDDEKRFDERLGKIAKATPAKTENRKTKTDNSDKLTEAADYGRRK